jgi:ribosomal protein S21
MAFGLATTDDDGQIFDGTSENDKITSTMEKALRELCKNIEKDTILATMSQYGYSKFAEIKMKDYNAIRVQLENGRKN